jgi:hypothetical protein
VHIQLALNTGCHRWEDDSRLSLETFSATINEGLYRIGVFSFFGNRNKHGVDPTAGLDAVQPANYKLELLVKLLVEVLDTVVVGCDGDALNSLLDESSGNLCFVFANIIFSE